jgi:hypothetical protein
LNDAGTLVLSSVYADTGGELRFAEIRAEAARGEPRPRVEVS